MMTVLPGRALLKFAHFFRSVARFQPSAHLPHLDTADMPEWQKRDLGFRDGRVNFHDDIWRR